MTTLEIRAGRTLSEALEHFGDRLGLDEARSFATLLQQSEELGSSLTEALWVYSDDMRHQRLSRAEEKAYSLPAKLSVPLTLCVFPVVIIVIMLPVRGAQQPGILVSAARGLRACAGKASRRASPRSGQSLREEQPRSARQKRALRRES